MPGLILGFRVVDWVREDRSARLLPTVREVKSGVFLPDIVQPSRQ